MDDTASLESRGTGKLTREVARIIFTHWPVFGNYTASAHVHPDILYTCQ